MSVSVTGPEARTALVTGASAGIGAVTAVELGALGWRVALGARRLERLEETARRVEEAGGQAFAHFLDMASEPSIEAFHRAAVEALGPVDVLVNNAGMNVLNRLAEAAAADLRQELEVNLLGPLLLSRLVIPAMSERGAGDLVFVSSENALRPRPYQIAYTASKTGLEAAARVLEMELEGSGVRTTIVRVGPTGTEFGARMDPERLQEALDAWRYWGVQRHLHWMPARSVARAIVQAVTTPADAARLPLIEVMPPAPPKAES